MALFECSISHSYVNFHIACANCFNMRAHKSSFGNSNLSIFIGICPLFLGRLGIAYVALDVISINMWFFS